MWPIKLLVLMAGVVLLYLAGVILLALVTEYRPQQLSVAEALYQGPAHRLVQDELVLYSWNLGYAGLGAKADFFYDGGRQVRSPQAEVRANLDAIKAQVASWRDADAILLQEVDTKARRSWYLDQAQKLADVARAGQWSAAFAKNYEVRFVPRPFLEPMGEVNSGLMSLTRWRAASQRISYPGSFPLLLRLFFLKRCILLSRTPWQGKELVLINTHNSAFDDGRLKVQEMAFLGELLRAEYAKGNFVVVGGDWNQLPPGKAHRPGSGQEDMPVDPAFPGPGWQWVADLDQDSNRSLKTAYEPGQTPTTTLDFFLLSPNLRPLEVKTLNLGFAHSDHNPVRLRLGLQVPAHQ
jgi:endonuclease/exonuclease/phosphatase family metal-dependent hydrolase